LEPVPVPVSQTPQTPSPWAIVAGIAVGVVTVWGALKVCGQIIKSAADDYVLNVLRRKKPELRSVAADALEAELATGAHAAEKADTALRLAEANALAVGSLADSVSSLTSTVNNDLPRMAQALETSTRTLEGVATTLERINHELGYVRGRVDSMAGAGVSIPAGAQLPVGRG
jgi:ABC-type transporter Mla subunit MlaD